MANVRRGEICAELSGETYTLCLTLGALAELEQAFGADDLVALVRRFETSELSARDLIRLLGAGLRGAGVSISDHQVAEMSVPDGVPGFIRIAASLLAATFGGDKPKDEPQNPSVPQNA